jgi:hypothetical protein
MLQRLSVVLLAGILLAGSAQGSIISLSGTLNFNTGSAGNPPNYLGAGRYAFSAQVNYSATATSPTPVQIASVDFSAAGFLAPYDIFTFPVNAANFVSVSGTTGTDTVTIALNDIPGQALDNQQAVIFFRFTNVTNPISTDSPTDANVAAVLNGATLDVFGSSLFQAAGDPPQITLQQLQDAQFSFRAAPEPSSFALLGVLSVGGAGCWYRRRKKTGSV